MAQSDQPQPNRTDPATEVAQLRRTMIQHLTASGKLLKAVFDIDRDYFGSRYQAKVQEGAGTPFREVEIATQVVETLSEELQGAAAFADSPVLRDNIANLVAGIEQLRSQLIDLEKMSLSAVGLPTEKVAFGARVFPDNNPLACVNEATGFVRDAHAWLVRTQERIKALRMMLQEAEKARTEAEQSVQSISSDEIAETLGAELKARDDELARLRQHANLMQEQLAVERRGGGDGSGVATEELETLRGELISASEQVRSDRAEVRSLVVEIEQIAAGAEADARPDGKDQVDDLVINLSVLRDAIADGESSIATLTTSADAVLVEWSAWVARRERLAAQELATTRAFVAQHQGAQRLADEAGLLKGELAKARSDAERVQRELGDSRERLAKAEAEQTRVRSELAKAEAARADAVTAVAVAKRETEQARTEAASAKAAANSARAEAIKAKGESERAAADLARARTETNGARSDGERAATDAAQAKATSERAATDAAKAKAEVERAAVELVRVRAEAAAAAKTEIERVQAESTRVAERARTETAAGKAEVESVRATAAKAGDELARAKAAQTQAAGELDKLRADVSRLDASLAQARTAADADKADLDRQRATGETAKTEAGHLRAEVDRQRIALEQANRDLTQAKAREQQAATDLAQARDQAAAVAARLDAAAKGGAEVGRERDDQRRQLEALRASSQASTEQAARATAAREQEMAAARGKLAEVQQLQTSLTRERDEARQRLDDIRKSTESLSSQSAQKQDSLARELTALREAEAKAKGDLAQARGETTRLESRLQTLEREAQQAREAVIAKQAELVKLGEQLAAQQTAGRQQADAIAGELGAARAAAGRLDGELAQAKTRIAGLEASVKQLGDERAALATQKTELDRRGGDAAAQAKQLGSRLIELQGQLDSAKMVATATAGERDKLRRELERLQGEQSAFAKRMEERESAQTLRLTETGRQLGEQKQLYSRLEDERNRLLADKERLEAERRDKQADRSRDSTGNWAKRLSDTAATNAELSLSNKNLQKRLDDARKHEAELAEASARLEHAAKHHADRIRELERQIADLKSAAGAARGASEREHQISARQRVVEGDRAKRDQEVETRLGEMKTLLRDARVAVVAAKQREVEMIATDKAIIADLMRQVTDLGGKPKLV